jgi:hypothetical protein
MVRIVAIAALALLALLGEWTYRGFIRPIDPLQPQVLALAEYFNRSGIPVRPYAVRHGYRHSQVTAAAAFEIIGYPLGVSVDLCPNEVEAQQQLAAIAASPNLTHPDRNGDLVMYLPMWGDDTKEMAARIGDIFASFRAGT